MQNLTGDLLSLPLVSPSRGEVALIKDVTLGQEK